MRIMALIGAMFASFAVALTSAHGIQFGGINFPAPASESFITYDCATSAAPIYLPDCAQTDVGLGCSFLPGEEMSVGVILDHVPVAVGMSAKAAFGEHRYWELAISDVPGDWDVPAACRDRSDPGDLEPRVQFQPVYVNGCPRPTSATVWVNVRPIGPLAEECGHTRECRTVVYGP